MTPRIENRLRTTVARRVRLGDGIYIDIGRRRVREQFIFTLVGRLPSTAVYLYPSEGRGVEIPRRVAHSVCYRNDDDDADDYGGFQR